MNLNSFKKLLLRIYKPTKSREYVAFQMTRGDFYKIASDKNKAVNKFSFKNQFFPPDDIYIYERIDNLIHVSPLSSSGGHDTSATIKIVADANGTHNLKVTYYKPTILNTFVILVTIFISIIGLIADAGWKILIAILVCLSISLVNYIIFLNDWRKIESEILKTYNLYQSLSE